MFLRNNGIYLLPRRPKPTRRRREKLTDWLAHFTTVWTRLFSYVLQLTDWLTDWLSLSVAVWSYRTPYWTWPNNHYTGPWYLRFSGRHVFLWVVTQCSLAGKIQRFRGTYFRVATCKTTQCYKLKYNHSILSTNWVGKWLHRFLVDWWTNVNQILSGWMASLNALSSRLSDDSMTMNDQRK
jgi:hypothetical protein